MNDAEQRFVERYAQHLQTSGIPPMAGRLWAWLLICDPAEQTAGELAEALHASRGAISGAARTMVAAGFIHRGRRRGERREYFSVPPGAIRRLILDSRTTLTRGREIAGEGLALHPGRDGAGRERLQDLHDMYAYFEREWPRVIEDYLEDREAAAAARATATIAEPGRNP